MVNELIKVVEAYARKPNPDRHRKGRTITLRVSDELYDRLQIGMVNNRAPRPHAAISSYVIWLLETQFLRKR